MKKKPTRKLLTKEKDAHDALTAAATLGARAYLLRMRLNRTQQEIADHIGVSVRTVGRIERNLYPNVTLDVLCALATTFGVSTDELLGMKRAA